MRNAFTSSNPDIIQTEKEQGVDDSNIRRKSSLFYDLGQQEFDKNDDSHDLNMLAKPFIIKNNELE